MVDPEDKFWESEWKKDPELMARVGECHELADATLQQFQDFDGIVEWAERIAEENRGKIVEKHFDTIRIEFEQYPDHLVALAREHPGDIILRQATEEQPAEMEIDIGWGWD